MTDQQDSLEMDIPVNMKPIYKTDRFEIYVLGVNNVWIKTKNNTIHHHVYHDGQTHITAKHLEVLTYK